MAGILTEAFQKLNLLNEEAFEGSKSGLERMADFIGGDLEDETIEVIDPNTEDEEDLEDSYIGKVIFRCPVCRSFVYHDKENINFDEDSDTVNIDEECPYCHSVGGFEIVGEVAPYADVNVKVDDEGEAETEAEDTSEALKEAYKPEHVVKGNPVITWKSEDEDRYTDGQCDDDFQDQAAFAAFLANSAGEKVYAFGGFDDDDDGMWLDIDGDGTFQKYIYSRGRLYSLDEALTEADKPAAVSIEDAQKWVDYDMKRYGKISERTNRLVKKAGFQILKDDHGDYEVAAGHFESLKEGMYDGVKIPAPYDEWFMFSNYVPGEDDYQIGEEVGGEGRIIAYIDVKPEYQDVIEDLGYYLLDSKRYPVVLINRGRVFPLNLSEVRKNLSKRNESLNEARVKPDYMLEEDDYIFHEDTGDIAISSDLVDFEPGRYINIKFADDNVNKIYKYRMKKMSDDGNYVECEYITDKITEARDLTKTPGTIAKLLNDHMDEINAAATSVFALKAKLKEIVNNSDLADKPAAQKFNAVMDSKKNVSALLSTIATYMTGMKSESVTKCPKCGKEPCECAGDLQEDLGSWIAARKLKKLEKSGKAGLSDEEKKNFDLKRKEYQARAQRGARKADPITGKKANWTQRNLDKANELKKAGSAELGKETKQKNEVQRTRSDLLKKWGLKDLDELKKVLASAHLSLGEALRMTDDKLNEAFEKVELETATEKIKVESEPKEDKSQEETIAPLTTEQAEEIVDINEPEDVDIDIDEFDADEIGELGESYLKRVYENVNSFKVSNKKLDSDKLIVEGLITFNSGKTLNTSFQFSPSTITKSGKVKLIGENLGITKRKGAFTLSGKLDGKKLISESLTYNYSAKASKDAKAQRVYGRVTTKK